MASTKRDIINRVRIRERVILAALIPTVIFVVGSWWCVQRLQNNQQEAADMAAIIPIRLFILQAAEITKTDAPIEPKTGDIYFPEARLYLPASPALSKITYAPAADTGNGVTLSVSTKAIFHQAAVPMHNAKDNDELFQGVPKLQACQRGVKLVYSRMDDEQIELRHTIPLSNGKTLYMYTEKLCPELNETADALKNISPY